MGYDKTKISKVYIHWACGDNDCRYNKCGACELSTDVIVPKDANCYSPYINDFRTMTYSEYFGDRHELR